MTLKFDKDPAFPEQLRSGGTMLQRDAAGYRRLSTRNIENFIGTVRMPVGLAGPVVVRGDHAQGTFFIPLATTEGTLVASTSRGMKLMNECGGVRVKVVRNGGIQRAPVFEFATIDDAQAFTESLNNDWAWLVPVMEKTTSHGKVVDISAWQMGRTVCVRMTMDPADASGQNMVSIASQRGAQAIAERFATISRYRMGGGISGEKVPSSVNTLLGRGKSVAASVSIDGEVLRRITRAEIVDILRHQQNYSNYSMWGGNQNSHASVANTVAAMYIATGQDVAAAVESRWANNILEHDVERNTLTWDLHIPNLVAGTVGGGTGLPTQRECLEVMGCHGGGKIDKFAELCAVAALANEISFWSALCAHEWIDAHASLKTR